MTLAYVNLTKNEPAQSLYLHGEPAKVGEWNEGADHDSVWTVMQGFDYSCPLEHRSVHDGTGYPQEGDVTSTLHPEKG